MINISQLLASELKLKPHQVENALKLLAEGATIPFIARYRKERTDEMDEMQLRDLQDRYNYLTELEERKKVIVNAIAQQDKLTPELQAKIASCRQKTELEDLYLPYRPKRRTRATVAREKGLEPLAIFIESVNVKNGISVSLQAEAAKYISETLGVKNVDEALKGASDILAEEVAEKAELRAYIRNFLLENGVFISHIKDEHPQGTTKFEMYRNYQIKVKNIAPHNMLALCRGEDEKILSFEIAFDQDLVLGYLESQEIKTKVSSIRDFYQVMLKDSFNRLMKTSLISEVIKDKKTYADIESIKTFETNLRELLLSAPAGMKATMAIDPGFRTGCKVAILDETGKFLEYQAVFPHQAAEQRQKAAQTIKKLLEKYQIQLIAIGNGTASRETEEFMAEILVNIAHKPVKVMVNESGASIYSASE
ncbi:MAG: Tex-like N-terminal domain-containing protein, partial [Dolichospermum sp.]